MNICTIDNCIKKHYGKGLCKLHYLKKWRKENQEKINQYKIHEKEYRAQNKEKTQRYNKNYHLKHREIIITRMRDRYNNNKEKYKEYRDINKENYVEYRQKNKLKLKLQKKEYYTKNKKDFIARVAKRRATELKQTPVWSDLNAIKEFYKNCPPGYHVDHIIPLQGKNVRGLHVIENLQYLPASENLKKGNRCET